MSVARVGSATCVGWRWALFRGRQPRRRGLVLSPTSLEVPTAGSADYTVNLATHPTTDVEVTISGGQARTCRWTLRVGRSRPRTGAKFGSKPSLRPRTTTRTRDSATLAHTASGGGYGSVTSDLPVTVTDTTRMRLAAIVGTVTEGESMSQTPHVDQTTVWQLPHSRYGLINAVVVREVLALEIFTTLSTSAKSRRRGPGRRLSGLRRRRDDCP